MEKKKQNLLLIIMGLLILAELAITVVTVNRHWTSGVCLLLSLVPTALYGFVLYKKPHGNMLKVAMLIFVLYNILSTFSWNQYDEFNTCAHIIRMTATAAVAYGAGRLERIEQNRILFPIIAIVYSALSIFWSYDLIGILNNLYIIRLFTTPIIFITLMIAYFVRYKEHKEAGLTDK